jgi:hypothetical protein
MTPELDLSDGQMALLHLRDGNGIDWSCAAILSPLRSLGQPETTERAIMAAEEMTILSFKVVVQTASCGQADCQHTPDGGNHPVVPS